MLCNVFKLMINYLTSFQSALQTRPPFDHFFNWKFIVNIGRGNVVRNALITESDYFA